jgi:hypothetical protein
MNTKNWVQALTLISTSMAASVMADVASAGEITPPVEPIVDHGADLFLTGDFIYWKARQDNMQYARTGVQSNPTGSVKQGSEKDVHFEFEPGFKVGLGLITSHDGWDLYLNYTWLNPAKHSNQISGSTAHPLTPLWGTAIFSTNLADDTTQAIDFASSTWKLNFNVVDLELGRNFYLSRRLTMRPHIGLKTAWLNEKSRVTYSVVNNILSPPTLEEIIRFKEKIWGLGIRGGFDNVWHLSKHWGVYGDLALSALWSEVSAQRKGTLFPQDYQWFDVNKAFHHVMPVLEMGIGLTYMTWFSDNSYMFKMDAGWEEQVWFDTNYLPGVSNTVSGNLTLQGFTLNVEFAF